MAMLLRAQNDPRALKTFLNAINLEVLRGRPEDFITLAQLFVLSGLKEKDVNLGYAKLMTFGDKPSVHMRYHGLFFGAEGNGNLVPNINVVGIDTVVALRTNG